jgi:streptogramin lyase
MNARTIGVGIGVIGAVLLLAAPALAVPAVDGEFALPAGVTVGSNNEIVEGPDGNMWVTTEQSSVVRIKPDGTAEGPFPTTNSVQGITVGPDNNLWAASAIGVVKIPPATPASAVAFGLGAFSNGFGITTGPDGNMWVVGGDQLVRFSTADPTGSADPTPIPGMSAKGMDTGSDGLLWIADGSGRVISATAADTPVVTPYQVDGGPQDVAAGLNAQVAYANPLDSPHEVGLISPGATPQQIPLETSDPFGVVFGQDGAYWVARSSTDDLLRLAPDGTTTKLTGFSDSGNVGPRKVATGPNNTLWVTLDTQEKVARVTGVELPPTGGGDTETTIDKGPKKKLKTAKSKAKVKFRFSSSDPAATFECKLKKPKRKGGHKRPSRAAEFAACASPKKYKLKPGKYTFQVRAVAGGVADSSPSSQKFKVIRDRT